MKAKEPPGKGYMRVHAGPIRSDSLCRRSRAVHPCKSSW